MRGVSMHALHPVVLLLTGLCFSGLCAAALSAARKAAAAYGAGTVARTARGLEDVFLFVPPRRVAEAAAALAATAAALVFLGTGGVSGPAWAVVARAALALLAGGAALAAPPRVLEALRHRRRARLEAQLEGVLLDMGNALRSGFSIAQAVERVAEGGEPPISVEFATALHQARVGVPLDDALRNMAARVGSEDLSLVVVSIETARKSGGNLAEVFETISATIRSRLRIKARVRTLTAQGRMQGVVLSLMPVVVCGAMAALQPALFEPFLRSPAGVAALALAALLVALGALSIRKIVAIDV